MEEGGQVREEEKERGGKERSKGWEKGKKKEEGSKNVKGGKSKQTSLPKSARSDWTSLLILARQQT